MRIFFAVRGKIQHISALLKYSGTANTTGRCPEPRRVQARPDPACKTAFCLSLRGLFVPMDVRSISEIAGSIYLLFRLGRSVHSPAAGHLFVPGLTILHQPVHSNSRQVKPAGCQYSPFFTVLFFFFFQNITSIIICLLKCNVRVVEQLCKHFSDGRKLRVVFHKHVDRFLVFRFHLF